MKYKELFNKWLNKEIDTLEFIKKAHIFFKRARNNSTKARILNDIGITLFSIGQLEEAADILNEARKWDPKYPDIYINLILIYVLLNDPESVSNVLLQTPPDVISNSEDLQEAIDNAKATFSKIFSKKKS